jgi:hypothetical protein
MESKRIAAVPCAREVVGLKSWNGYISEELTRNAGFAKIYEPKAEDSL